MGKKKDKKGKSKGSTQGKPQETTPRDRRLVTIPGYTEGHAFVWWPDD